MTHVCKDCDIEFDTAAALDVHKRKFCAANKGSRSLAARGGDAEDEEAVRAAVSALTHTRTHTRRKERAGASAPARESSVLRERRAERERGGDGAGVLGRRGERGSVLAAGGAAVLESKSAGARRAGVRAGEGDRDAFRERMLAKREALSTQLAELRAARGGGDRRGGVDDAARDRLANMLFDDGGRRRSVPDDAFQREEYLNDREFREPWHRHDERGGGWRSERERYPDPPHYGFDGYDYGRRFPASYPRDPYSDAGYRGPPPEYMHYGGGYGPPRAYRPSGWDAGPPGGGHTHDVGYGPPPIGWQHAYYAPPHATQLPAHPAQASVPSGAAQIASVPTTNTPAAPPTQAITAPSRPPPVQPPRGAGSGASTTFSSPHGSSQATPASSALSSAPPSPLMAAAAELAAAAGPPPFADAAPMTGRGSSDAGGLPPHAASLPTARGPDGGPRPVPPAAPPTMPVGPAFNITPVVTAAPAPPAPPPGTHALSLPTATSAVPAPSSLALPGSGPSIAAGAVADAALAVMSEDTSIAMLLQLPRQVLETEYVQRQLKNLLEIREMRVEADKLRKQRELDVLRAQLEREKEEIAQQAAHEIWLAQQKRLVREAKIRKALVKELGEDVAAQYLNAGAPMSALPSAQSTAPTTGLAPSSSFYLRPGASSPGAFPAPGPPTAVHVESGVQGMAALPTRQHGAGNGLEAALGVDINAPSMRAYDAATGVHLLFDFAMGLPAKATKVQVAYCFYVGDAAVGAVQAIAPLPTEIDMDNEAPPGQPRLQRCSLGQQRIVDGDAAEDVALVVELQRVTETDVRSIGWTAVPLFKRLAEAIGGGSQFTSFGGYIRLALFKPPVAIRGGVLASVRDLTPLKGSLYIRMYTHAQYTALVEAARIACGAPAAAAASILNGAGRDDAGPHAQPLLRLISPSYAMASAYTPLLDALAPGAHPRHSPSGSPSVSLVAPPSQPPPIPARPPLDGVVGLDILSSSWDSAGRLPNVSPPGTQLRATVFVGPSIASVPRLTSSDAGALTAARMGDHNYNPLTSVLTAAPRVTGHPGEAAAQLARAPTYGWDSPAGLAVAGNTGAPSGALPGALAFELLPLQPPPHRAAAPNDVIATDPSHLTIVLEVITGATTDTGSRPTRALWAKFTMCDIIDAMRAYMASAAAGGQQIQWPQLVDPVAAVLRPEDAGLPCTIPIGLILPVFNAPVPHPSVLATIAPEAALPDPSACTVMIRLRCSAATLQQLAAAADVTIPGYFEPSKPGTGRHGSMRRGLSVGGPEHGTAPLFDARTVSASGTDAAMSREASAGYSQAPPPVHPPSYAADRADSWLPSPTREGEELAWCDVTWPPPPQVPFSAARDVFDVYVDAARFLSDNVTITKAVVKVLSSGFKPVGTPFESVCDLHSSLLSPRFHAAARFIPATAAGSGMANGMCVVRLPADIDPTATVVIRIDTIESHSHQVQVAGYAVLNLFALAGGSAFDQPPVGSKMGAATVLNEGAFQLPLFQAPPAKSAPLSAECLSKSPRVPCATVLVRIHKLVDARVDAPRAPVPTYASQAYDSTRCRPLPAEVLLYPKRAEVPAPTVTEFLDHFADAGAALGIAPTAAPIPAANPSLPSDLVTFGVPPPRASSDAARIDWCEKRLASAPVSMLDFQYLAPYDASMGFKVRVDGVHQLPPRTQAIVKVLHSISPPGAFYNNPKDASAVYFTQQHDWNSSVKTQLYRDGYAVHVGMPFDPSLVIIFEVVAVVTKRSGEQAVEPVGWGVLPVFDYRGEGYVNRGAFVVPLLEGAPTQAIINMFHDPALPPLEVMRRVTGLDGTAPGPEAGAAGFLARRFGSNRNVLGGGDGSKALCSFVKEGTSLLVRMHDGQFTGIMGVPASAYSTAHVPSEVAARYEMGTATLDALAVDAAPLTRLLPKKMGKEEFEAQVNEILCKAMGLNPRARASLLSAGALPASAALAGLTSVGALPPSMGPPASSREVSDGGVTHGAGAMPQPRATAATARPGRVEASNRALLGAPPPLQAVADA